MSSDIPKTSPDSIARPVLERWLDRNAGVPLRLIAAPPASGKTTGVALWARARATDVAWITVPSGATKNDLCALLLCALSPADGVDLQRALRTTTKKQIVIDAADAADAEARSFLSRLYAEAPGAVTFVYLARSTQTLDVLRGITAGIAVSFDASLFRFDDALVEQLCALHDVVATPTDRARLVQAGGGWPLAVAGTIRYAAGLGAALDTAFPRWMESSRGLLAQLVDEAVANASPAAAETFNRAIVTGGTDVPLDELEAAGLFVDYVEGSYELNPVIRAAGAAGTTSAFGRAVLHMFGRFRVTLGDVEIEFVRRRDRQILQYLALQPDGAATRAELLSVFWPESEPSLAGQALRTACSTIRRSFAQLVGRAGVDAYFRTEGAVVRLRLDNVLNTMDRFRSHVDLASVAEEDRRTDAAFAHWAAAVRLYAAPLLAGEPPADWMADAQRQFEALGGIAAERFHELQYIDHAARAQARTA